MNEHFIYDCEDLPRRDINQCENDIIALLLLSMLCVPSTYCDYGESDTIVNFYKGKCGFRVESEYSEEMQKYLLSLKVYWKAALQMKIVTQLIAFTVDLIQDFRVFKKFICFYKSEENTIYLSVERLLQGIATTAVLGDGFFFKNDTTYWFDEDIALAEFEQFKRLLHVEKFFD